MTDTLAPAVAIARDLIRCPSVTPDEAGVLDVLEAHLKAVGFTVERVTFHDEETPDIENLFATIGTGKPHFAFAGHVDVVPVGATSDWKHAPFDGVIEDSILYGRGAVDMKGGVAASAAAAIAFVEENGADFGGQISFLITGDEEGPGVNGTVKLMQWAEEQGHHFDACILGEPTNPDTLGDAIKVGRRGSLSGIIMVEGVQGHVAYPHLAHNPIPDLLKLANALVALKLDEGNARFQPSNLELVAIDVANPVFNIIPARAEARFNVRYNDEWTMQSLKDKLEATLEEAAGNSVKWSLTYRKDGSESFLTKDDALINGLSAAIEAELGVKPELSTGGGTSDARFIKNYCPVVEFGLVGQTMHKVDERVEVADLERLAAIYRRFLDSYFPKGR